MSLQLLMAAPPAFWLATGLAGIYLIGYCYKPQSLAKSATKTSAVLVLAIVALGAENGPVLGLALALCAIGDYLLSRDGDIGFMAGVAAFATGHLVYITLFLTHPASTPGLLTSGPLMFVAIALGVLAIVMGFVLAPRAGDLRVPVLIYIPIIVGMGLAALTLTQAGPTALAIPGAMLFVASDFVLALEMFVLADKSPLRKAAPFVVWTTYWLAQSALFLAFTSVAQA